jgi:hypothetical protein
LEKESRHELQKEQAKLVGIECLSCIISIYL